VEFNASNTKDNDPKFPSTGKYTWTFFYDNKTQTLNGKITAFKFEMKGEYEIKLTATDAAGNPGYDTMIVDVAADNNPPYITKRYPDPDAHDVSYNAKIWAEFSESLMNSSIDRKSGVKVTTGEGKEIPGTIVYDKAQKRITFTAAGSLGTEMMYTVRISADITDLGGNKLIGSTSWNFWTSDLPHVIQTSPANNAENVDVDTKTITCTFNEPIKAGNLGEVMVISPKSGSPLEGKAVLDQKTNQLIFTLEENLTYNTTYIVTVGSKWITDSKDNGMKEDHVFSFTTELQPSTGDDDIVVDDDDDDDDDDGLVRFFKDNMWYILVTIIVLIIIIAILAVVMVLSRRDKREEVGAMDDDWDDEDYDDDWDDDFDDEDDYYRPKKRSSLRSRYDDEYEDDYDYDEPYGSSGRRTKFDDDDYDDDYDDYEEPYGSSDRRTKFDDDDWDDDDYEDDYDDYEDDYDDDYYDPYYDEDEGDQDGYWDKRYSESRKEKASSAVDWEEGDDDDDWDDDDFY
jgi:hypothetical protein